METVLADIAAFTESRNPDVLPDLEQHLAKHTDEILRLVGGGPTGDFMFVREYARRRAGHRFPLEAILHAYRCLLKVVARHVRQEVTARPDEHRRTVDTIADFLIEYADAISTIATDAYLSQTRLHAEVGGDQRAEMLTILLNGYDESDGRVARLLRNAGYLDGHQSFCVALARSVDPTEMLNPARARRLADAIDEILERSRMRRVIDLRDNKVTVVFSDSRRASGWTAPHSALAERVSNELSMVGNAALIGISNDVPSTSQIPGAYAEAQLALDLADVTRRVQEFSAIAPRQLMLHFAGEEMRGLLPGWSSKIVTLDANGALVATLRAYASADMNVLRAAEQLSVHPNTIYSRFQRIRDLTGLDARNYHMLTELLIVADCVLQQIRGQFPQSTMPNMR